MITLPNSNSLQTLLYRRYKNIEIKKHELRYLFLEITRNCNLTCIHCGSDCSKDRSMPEMTTDSWISIIDYMQEIYSPFFVITGGEPLVCDGLMTITNHLKSIKARWGMVTNGMALDQKRLNTLVENGLESLTLSLDGNRESHLYIRRSKGSWDRALKAMEIIGRSNIRTRDVVTCVFPGNIGALDETAELLIKNSIPNWRLFRIFPKGAAKNNQKLHLTFDESNYLISWISKNRLSYKQRGLNITFCCEGYLPIAIDNTVRDEPYFCRAGINIASILSDGTVTGCNNNGPDFYQGNLINSDFKDLWDNEFKEYRNSGWKKTGICEECKEWRNCRGGSIHLRERGHNGPLFCYVKDVNR